MPAGGGRGALALAAAAAMASCTLLNPLDGFSGEVTDGGSEAGTDGPALLDSATDAGSHP